MSERKRRQFSPEFKLEAVRLVTEGGRPVGQVARERGMRAEMSSCGHSLASLAWLAAPKRPRTLFGSRGEPSRALSRRRTASPASRRIRGSLAWLCCAAYLGSAAPATTRPGAAGRASARPPGSDSVCTCVRPSARAGAAMAVRACIRNCGRRGSAPGSGRWSG